MKISYKWLKDYVDIKAPAEEVARLLTMAGLSVESVRKMGDDSVIEIEVTANRPDWLSFIGVARELAALTGEKAKIPPPAKIRFTAPQRAVQIKIEDKALCPRYTARVIRDVKTGDSSAWLKERLGAMELRPVNNIVDITNFCLFETGEPMHAFDLDKIDGGEVIIRKAKAGERITTIDGVERKLETSDLVIADRSKPIAIAGVMGGLNTEVNFSTQNILLEAAYFDPISVRRTSRRLALSTESSYRFERKVDRNNIVYSSDRASELILKLAGGSAEKLIDAGGGKETKKTVDLRYSKVGDVLGLAIPAPEIKKILVCLGLKAKTISAAKAKFEIPSFRHDLTSEIDLIEEVSRIYGYDRFPSTLPTVVDQPLKRPAELDEKRKIRTYLAAMGCYEIITYSLLGGKALSASRITDENAVRIRNPLTSEQEVMRPSLIPGMMNTILWNINRKSKDLKLFELGKIYIKEETDKFCEWDHLSIGIAGEISSWESGSRAVNFFDLKGMIENFFAELGIKDVSFKHTKNNIFSSSSASSIVIGGDCVGVMGEIAGNVLANFDIKEKVYACEICASSILEILKPEKRFASLPKYPSVSRDISIVVEKSSLNAEIVSAIKTAAGPILKNANLIDRYTGKQIPDGKIGLTYRLEYQDLQKTLEEKEVSGLHAKVLHELETKFGARLR